MKQATSLAHALVKAGVAVVETAAVVVTPADTGNTDTAKAESQQVSAPVAAIGAAVEPSSKSDAGKPKKQAQPVTTATVFDAQRRDKQEDFLNRLRTELIPSHNAECEDIAREHDEIFKANQARAKTKKRARILRLASKKWEIINQLSIEFRLELEEVAKEFKGEVTTVTERVTKGGKSVEEARQKVTFPDGSFSMLKKLYIPFDEFKKA